MHRNLIRRKISHTAKNGAGLPDKILCIIGQSHKGDNIMNVMEYGTQNEEIIMLLHGGGLSWWNYKAETALLSQSYHVILPILDGHAGSDDGFTSIEENAARIIAYIDGKYGGRILLLGGLSLGAQILTEILARRKDICQYAIIESASVLPSTLTTMLIGPLFSISYPFIRRQWFSRLQFRYLRMPEDLYENYYKDTCRISKNNMISFLKASTSYKMKASIKDTNARVFVYAGGKEQLSIRKSARLLQDIIPASTLEIKPGFYHGEYSLSNPAMYTKNLLAMCRCPLPAEE